MDIEIKKAEVENINKNKSKLRRCEYHNLPLHFIDENTLKLLCIHCVKDQSRLGIISSILISEKLSRNVNTWLKLESDIVNLQSQINNQIIQVDLLLVMRKEREQEQLIEIIENEDESQNQAEKENTGQILSQNIYQQKILRDRIFLKEMEKVYQPAIKLSQVNQQNEASNSVVSEQNMKLLGIIDNKGLVQEGFLIIQRDISKENLKRLKKCYKYIDEDIQKVKEQNQNQDIEGVIKLQGYYNEHLTIIEKIKDTYRKIGQEIDIIEKYLTKQTQNTGSRLDQIALCSIDDCNQWYKEQQIFKAMMKISSDQKQHQENLHDKTNPKELQYQLIVKLFNMQNQLLDKIREQESNIRKKQSQNIEIIQNIKEEAEHYSKLQKKEQELDKFEELQKQEELLMQQKQQYQQRQNQQNYQNPQSYQQQQSHQQNDRDYYNRQPYNQQQKFQTQNTQNYSNPEQYNNQATYSHKDAFYNNHYQQRYQHQQNPYSNRNQNNYQQQSQDLQQHQQRQQQQYQQEPNYGQQNQNNQQNKNYQRQSQNTQQNYQMKNLNNQFDRLNM
eukprot:403349102